MPQSEVLASEWAQILHDTEGQPTKTANPKQTNIYCLRSVDIHFPHKNVTEKT